MDGPVDLIVRDDDSYESVGATDDGRELYLVSHWDIFDPERVFPITAYFLPEESYRADPLHHRRHTLRRADGRG